MDTNFLYFQHGLDSMNSGRIKDRTIQPADLLSIQVFSTSLNQDQVTLFNIPNNNSGVGYQQGYPVSTDGNIDFPVIGKIKVAGLTKPQLEATLNEKLSGYVKDPSVLIRFLHFDVNVLGEVKTPGIHSFEKDHVTVLDAIGAANDLTDYGKRRDVLVIRGNDSTNRSRKYYKLDLTSGSLFQSPAYQLQPDDIVYVGAKDKKLHDITKTTNYDNLRIWQFILSVLSVTASILFVTYNINK
jgi:polysaccharide export outer membrane protein